MKLPSILQIYQATEIFFKQIQSRSCTHSKGQLSQIYILCHKNFLKSIFCVIREIEIWGKKRRYIIAHSNAYGVAHMMIEWPPTYKQLLFFCHLSYPLCSGSSSCFFYTFSSLCLLCSCCFFAKSPLSPPLLCFADDEIV